MHPQWRALLTRFVLGAAVLAALGIGVASQLPKPSASSPTPTPTPTVLGEVPSTAQEKAVVSRVVDGDTIKIMEDGKESTVRLIGINTPETVDPQKPVECFGPAASDYTKNLLTGQTVFLDSDATQQDMDHYGRLLRYVYLPDGLFVNEKLVRDGYATEYTYDRPYRFRTEFLQAQAEAREADLGLWAACAATPDPLNT